MRVRYLITPLRKYMAREGHEVLEEVSDPGQSGASLERPGTDRVRDVVAAGGVSVVCWPRTGTASLESLPTTICSSASSRSMGAKSGLWTIGATRARHRIYKRLRLKAVTNPDGGLEMMSALSEDTDFSVSETTSRDYITATPI